MMGVAGYLIGFSVLGFPAAEARMPSISSARKDLQEGDLYQARKKTQTILDKNPADPEVQKLMAEIIDQEIARHKEVFQTTVPEELPYSAKEEETKTWLERGKVLLDLKRYDEAAMAVEKIFTYDPMNEQASRLMDNVREHALKDGKQELLVRHQMYAAEAKDRVALYLQQARESILQKRWGAARMAVDKILLLEPSNKKALKLQRQIESDQKKVTAHGAKIGATSSSEPTETKEFQ